MGKEGEAVQALLPEFRHQHPEIDVVVQQIPWNAAHEKLLTAHVGGHLPDLFQLGNTWIAEFVAIGAIQPLTERFHRTLPEADYFPGILATNRLDQTMYGVPWYVDTRLLYLRTDLLDEAGVAQAPRTWSQWWAALESLRSPLGPWRHPLHQPPDEWQMPVILALQLGSSLLRDDDRHGDFRGPAFREAFARYLELFRNGWAQPVNTAQGGNLYQEFARGEFALFLSGPWTLGEFARRLPRTLEGHWDTAPLPAPEGRPYPGLSIAGGASLVLARNSTRQELAWKLVEFLSEPAQQVAFYRETGDLPPRRSSWDRQELAAQTRAASFRMQLEHVVPLPQVPEWERIAAKIAYYAEKAIRGDLSPEEALERLDRDVDLILEKRRWLLDRAAD
jgi:multiple sugar transport system substrate-binding protein